MNTVPLLDRIVLTLGKTFALGAAMLKDIVERAFVYAKAYSLVIAFSVLMAIAQSIANKTL